MDLVLWRHAEAVPKGDDEDLERGLTSKGERQAERMAKWLGQRLAHSTRIIVSPALRCQQTAKALDRKFRTVDAIGPGASADEVIAAARWPDAAEATLVVGHQPTLGMVAAKLVTGAELAWSMKKGAVWWIRRRNGEEGVETLVQAVQSPDSL